MALLLAGCGVNARRFHPVYEQPQGRDEASRMLYNALHQNAPDMRKIAMDREVLSWEEGSAPPTALDPAPPLPRSLRLDSIRAVVPADHLGERWRLRVKVAGGDVVFSLDSVDAAARAEAALQRLARAD